MQLLFLLFMFILVFALYLLHFIVSLVLTLIHLCCSWGFDHRMEVVFLLGFHIRFGHLLYASRLKCPLSFGFPA